MRKIAFIGFVCISLLLFGVSVHADTFSFSTEEGDFTTKFWKEKYLGGGDGTPGNVLMAVGEGFSFQNAVLESFFTASVKSPCGGGTLPVYVTTYVGGRLTLNPSGPWDDNIIVRDITATNLSGFDNGKRFFILWFLGTSESGVDVEVTATFCEDTDNYKRQVTKKGEPVYQMGYNFDAIIEITYP